jgi:hypothetical protein
MSALGVPYDTVVLHFFLSPSVSSIHHCITSFARTAFHATPIGLSPLRYFVGAAAGGTADEW